MNFNLKWGLLAFAVLVLGVFGYRWAAGPRSAAIDSDLVIGMVLEPPGLDPTTGAAAAIGEITHLNIYEGLTRILETGETAPLLAERWTVSPDGLQWTFALKRGVKFHDGTDFDSADVKAAFERYGAADSLNKRKAVFANMTKIETPDAHTVRITLAQPNADFLFYLGENTAVITAPESHATNAQKPVGTGPYQFVNWVKGDRVELARAPTFRDADAIAFDAVTFKIINDAAAGVAALLAGDVDAFPIFPAYEAAAQLRADERFTVTAGTTEGETIVAVNNQRPQLNDVRVRRALMHAIDRQAVIAAATAGLGKPIGSHFPPHHPAYEDLTGLYPHDPERARALLAEAGAQDLRLSLKLPPPPYARQAGEVVAAQLRAVGVQVDIETMEFAQWLDVVFTNKNYDLTIISHVEPLDILVYANPNYYFGYDSEAFRIEWAKAQNAPSLEARYDALRAAQRLLAQDSVNLFLFQLPKVAVYRSDLTGFWTNAPIFVNDLAAVKRK